MIAKLLLSGSYCGTMCLLGCYYVVARVSWLITSVLLYGSYGVAV